MPQNQTGLDTGTPIGRIPVTKVSPVIEAGAYPAKAAVGEVIPIEATVFREGHDAVNATVVLIDPEGNESTAAMERVPPAGFDRWGASVVLDQVGLWRYRVEGWDDPFATWVHNAEIKIPAGIDVSLVCTEGARLFEPAADRAGAAGDPESERVLRAATAALSSPRQVEDRLEVALSEEVMTAMESYGPRELVSPSAQYEIFCDRRAALFASWYEFFPRSQGASYDDATQTWTSGTFESSYERLEAAAAMGFDVVYLPPIHPIGTAFRKGRTTPSTLARPTPARPGRSAVPTAATTPSTPISATSTPSTRSSPRPRASAWRWRSTSPCRPRRTIPG